MKRILILSVSAFISMLAFAQPMGMQQQSIYDQVDEVRKQLNLDHSQFEKVYSAYEKYNKAVFGNQSNGMMPPPPGGRFGGPMGPPPGNGGHHGNGAGFGGNHSGGQPNFNGQLPARHGIDNPNGSISKPEDVKKMEKKREKQEEKLVKSMQKIFKKDPAAFSKWQKIRSEQLKRMNHLPPNPAMPCDDRGE
ncbi:MAG: hypothetical protein K2H72_05015 [Muribaculaceae bacterium]|nr:hypothetical protein [Muribaculaceae bacterium]